MAKPTTRAARRPSRLKMPKTRRKGRVITNQVAFQRSLRTADHPRRAEPAAGFVADQASMQVREFHERVGGGLGGGSALVTFLTLASTGLDLDGDLGSKWARLRPKRKTGLTVRSG